MHIYRHQARKLAWYGHDGEPSNYNPFRKFRPQPRRSNSVQLESRLTPIRTAGDVRLDEETRRHREMREGLSGPEHADTFPPESSGTDQLQRTGSEDKLRWEPSGRINVSGADQGGDVEGVPRQRKTGLSSNGSQYANEASESLVDEHKGLPDKQKFTAVGQLKATLFNSWINVLLFAVPAGIALNYVDVDPVAVFVVNFIAIIPLAAMLSYGTEEIAMRTGETIGGLLNATFGNAVELIVSIIALVDKQIVIVQTSLIGSMLSNLLLVMGMCFFFGGVNRLEQHFNPVVAQTAASLLALAVASLIIPTAFHQWSGAGETGIAPLSRGTSIILLFVYGCYLFFQLKSHTEIYNSPSPKVEKRRKKIAEGDASRGIAQIGKMGATLGGQKAQQMQLHDAEEDEEEQPQLSLWVAVLTLTISTVFVALCAEYMVNSIDALTQRGHISETFVGLILLPIVGNAAEHATAVTVACKDKMDLAIGVAVGSSMQIALLVLPLVIVIGWIMGLENMTLYFDAFQVILLFVSVLLKERRKSLSVFGSSTTASILSGSGTTHDRSPSDDVNTLKKRSRRNSGFFGVRNTSPLDSQPQGHPSNPEAERPAGYIAPIHTTTAPELVRPRRRSLQKKRTSVFGSLRSLHSLDDDEKSFGRSRGSPIDDEDGFPSARQGIGSVILHHGAIQTTGGMWRKKSQYLVLTDTHLVRFKSQSKAAETFASIPSSYTRSPALNRQSIASINSLQEPQLAAPNDASAGIPLNSIIAVYMLDDGRPSSMVEVAYLDERLHKATFIQMQTPDLQELNLWMVGIRSAAELVRTSDPLAFDPKAMECVARMLDYERDYDPETFRMFRVIQMASSSKSSTRASSDDLTKLSPTGCYLALGSHKLHLIPLHKVSARSSVVSLSDMETATSFGLMNLTSLSMEWGDDSLHLTFRVPLRKPFSVFLASVHSLEVAFWLRQQTEFLRPLWLRQPFDFIVPRGLDNESNFPPVDLNEDYGCFDRTLVAYSASYDIDTSNIRYTIDMQCDDAPCFRLLPPASPHRQKYSALELIAVLRALRYNEFFRSLSFNGVSLDALSGVRDLHGRDKDASSTRLGATVHVPGQEHLTVLSQEIRALALKSAYLKRLDFSRTLSRTPKANSESRDPGCGIPEALFPICRRELTSVDCVALNGIKLGDSDLDYLVDAASQKGSNMRALEVGHCGLSVHDIDLLLSTIIAQASTLETLNISGVQGRLSPNLLQQYLGYFGKLKKLDLSRVSRTSGPQPLISAETLFKWQLEELSLSRTSINRDTVDAIATYLASDMSRNLRVLRLDQCGLSGQDVAIFLHSMAVVAASRDLHLYVSENRLDLGSSYLFEAIALNKTPSHMSMRMIDFKKEEQFQELVEALRLNETLKFLDISKASLPYDAGPDTCKLLQLMFEENSTLEDLDISGESAHLDVARFGIGLNLALTGLKKNKSLKVLKIEHQKLGLQGASTLASVLEENTYLREVHCENNDINLQSFTVLVNGLQRNRTLLHLSYMDRDRVRSLEKVRREIESVKRDMNPAQTSTTSSIRRSIHAAMHVKNAGVGTKLTKHTSTAHASRGATSTATNAAATGSAPQSYAVDRDIEAILRSLSHKWDAEVARLRRYLFRNYNVANGLDDGYTGLDGDDAASDGRPATAASLGTMLENLTLDGKASVDEVPTRSRAASQASPGLELQIPSKSPGPSKTENLPSHLDIFKSLDEESGFGFGTANRPQTADVLFSNHGSVSLTLDYSGSDASSARLAVPVPALPSITAKPNSVRSTRSSSTASTSAGTAASSRSTYGAASSTLRGFLARGASKERRGIEKLGSGPLYVASDAPPRLDWSPPQLGLRDFR